MKMFAKSLAGHDKNQIYFVCQEEEDYVFLTNGTTKKLEEPKKKRKKHIQIIKNLPMEVLEVLNQETAEQNQQIHKAIKCYEKYINKNKSKR